MEGDQKRKMRMNVGREPCILYETVELLYAYINGISADRLTMDRVYCIPAPEIARLMGAACAGVDRQDRTSAAFLPGGRFWMSTASLLAWLSAWCIGLSGWIRRI